MTPEEVAMQIDSCVAEMMTAPQFFDEVALCFRSEAELEHFVKQAQAIGVENFNSVERDRMVRQNGLGEFDVRFEFLRLPHRSWRIEAMCVLGGEAPLHEWAMESGSPVLIHLSYKCESVEAYQEEIRKLLFAGEHLHAEYRNSYGLFSYWTLPSQGKKGRLPYIKPRVNLRD